MRMVAASACNVSGISGAQQPAMKRGCSILAFVSGGGLLVYAKLTQG
jgi:hypothetical protein